MTQKNKAKLELVMGQEVRAQLLRDRCYEGSNGFGPYYLYNVAVEGAEQSFFAPREVHEAIVAHGLKKGDTFILRKVPGSNGNRLVGHLEFELPQPAASAASEATVTASESSDVYRDIMARCLADAIAIARSAQVDGVPLQAEDLRAISSCLFIARTRVN